MFYIQKILKHLVKLEINFRQFLFISLAWFFEIQASVIIADRIFEKRISLFLKFDAPIKTKLL
jgi:hypothetical protein